jgi:hypothetical protein
MEHGVYHIHNQQYHSRFVKGVGLSWKGEGFKTAVPVKVAILVAVE